MSRKACGVQPCNRASVVSGCFCGDTGQPLGRPADAQAPRAGRPDRSGDFSTSVNLSGGDELAELSGTIERMRGQLAKAHEAEKKATAEKIEALEKLRHTERLATLGQLSAGMAHELGTPLNVIAGRAKLICGAGLDQEDTWRSAKIIGEQAERMTTIMRQLLSFARRGEARKQKVDLNTVLRSIQPLLEPTAHKQGVDMVFTESSEALMVYADPGQLQQVLLNLSLNGIQAMPDGGSIGLVSRQAYDVKVPEKIEVLAERWFCLDVRDEGVGMDDETLKKVFDPSLRQKMLERGRGWDCRLPTGLWRSMVAGSRQTVVPARAAVSKSIFRPSRRMYE